VSSYLQIGVARQSLQFQFAIWVFRFRTRKRVYSFASNSLSNCEFGVSRNLSRRMLSGRLSDCLVFLQVSQALVLLRSHYPLFLSAVFFVLMVFISESPRSSWSVPVYLT